MSKWDFMGKLDTAKPTVLLMMVVNKREAARLIWGPSMYKNDVIAWGGE